MTAQSRSGRGVAAPRTTAALAAVFSLGVLAQATFAGAFLGGHDSWQTWHDNLGDVLILPPLASLLVGLAVRRPRRDTRSMLASRAALVVLVVLVIVAGHAGGGWLTLHVPAAVATAGLVARQTVAASQTRDTQGRLTPSHSGKPLHR